MDSPCPSPRLSILFAAALSCALTLCIWGYGGEDLRWVALGGSVLSLSLLMTPTVHWGKLLRRESFLPPILLILLLAIVGAANSAHVYKSVILITLVAVLLPTLVCMASLDQEGQSKVLLALVLVVTMYCLYGFLQVADIFSSNWHNAHYASRFVNSAHFSTMVAAAIPLALGIMLTSRRIMFRFLSALAVPINLVALAMTETRAAWLAFAVVMTLLLAAHLAAGHGNQIRRRGVMAPLLFACICAAVVAVLFKSSIWARLAELKSDTGTGISQRLSIWKSALEIISDNPFGVGLDAFSYVFLRYADAGRFIAMRAHNEILQLTAEVGWLALPLMVWILIGLALSARRSLSERDASHRLLSIYVCGAIAIYLLHSLVDFPLRLKANLVFFVALLGVLIPGGWIQHVSHRQTARLGCWLAVLISLTWWTCVGVSQGAWKRGAEQFSAYDFKLADDLLSKANKWMPLDVRAAYDAGRLDIARASISSGDQRMLFASSAIERLERARRLAPYWPYTHLHLARAFEYFGDMDMAETHFRSAVENDPRLGIFKWEYADFLWRSGRREQAVRAYRDALSSFVDTPGGPSLRDTLVRIYRESGDIELVRAACPDDKKSQKELSQLYNRFGVDRE